MGFREDADLRFTGEFADFRRHRQPRREQDEDPDGSR